MKQIIERTRLGFYDSVILVLSSKLGAKRVRRDAHTNAGKQGIWVSIFPDRENMGNRKNFENA